MTNTIEEAAQYIDTYVYKNYSVYEKYLFEFIMQADRIDTKSEAFDDILYDIKRRKISDNLAKIITSNNIVLAIHEGKALPKAFKVFAAKDAKEDKNKIKVFIDVTGCIEYKGGVYVCNKIEWLISYIINAMVSYIYSVAPNKILGNSNILKDGGQVWTNLFTYIVDRMYKISAAPQIKKRVQYMAAIYYQVNILMKDLAKNEDSIKANAVRISDIDDRDARYMNALIDPKSFSNIDTLVNSMKEYIDLKDFKTSNVIALWMNAFGTGTVFGLEYFPAFSAMMTNTYIGGYIDQQLTIEKISGPLLVDFVKTIFQIGASVS
jgi:hypothetical protein